MSARKLGGNSVSIQRNQAAAKCFDPAIAAHLRGKYLRVFVVLEENDDGLSFAQLAKER